MKWNPHGYFKFLENNIENYWRFPEKDTEKILQSDIGVLLKSFYDGMGQLRLLIQKSGVYDIEEISCKSEYFEENDKKFYLNKVGIEYDKNSKGFLRALLKKLPENKIPEIENTENIKDLHLIRDNTLLAFEMPLNFNEAVKTLPDDMLWKKQLAASVKEFFNMDIAEFADIITGEWGGIVYLNRNEKNQKEFHLDFIFILPDVGQKLYKKLGEQLILRRMAVFKDDLLNVRILPKYREMTVLSIDDFLLIVSSPQALLNLNSIAEEKKICEKIKELNVPEDIEYDGFCYWNEDFSTVVSSLLIDKSLPLKFMHDFSGNNSFNAFEICSDEFEIVQYSDQSSAHKLFMPFAVNVMEHVDNISFRSGRGRYIEHKIGVYNRKCLDDLLKYAKILKKYSAANNNQYPSGNNAAGLKKMAEFAKLPPDEFSLKNGKKTIPFGRFYYWGENFKSKAHNLPLLCDRGGVHTDKLHVLFCDGSIREFELKNIRSARRIASFLHTVFNYDSETFSMLLKQAERLDREKL